MDKLVADLRGRSTDKEYSVSLRISASHLIIEADNQLLYRAVSNLVDNAVMHNPAGTEVQIKVKQDEKDRVAIAVSDNGVGMPQNVIESLFGESNGSQILTSGKRDYVSGLGLSIVRSIVEAHNGDISAYSNEHAGLVVTMRLPLRQTSKEKC